MQHALSILARSFFALSAGAFITLLFVFPQVGTEDGPYTLYAMRRPVAVNRSELLLVLALLAGSLLGALGGWVCLILRDRIRR